jgi:hypothetical protein
MHAFRQFHTLLFAPLDHQIEGTADEVHGLRDGAHMLPDFLYDELFLLVDEKCHTIPPSEILAVSLLSLSL